MADPNNNRKKKKKGPGRGFWGHSEEHARYGRMGGLARRRNREQRETE